MEHDVVIDVKNLCCLSGNHYILNNISWQVRQGEQWVVFGRNGCGKTTLLSIIAGYKDFTKGKLKVLGESYSERNILEIRKKIGWISSSFFDKCYQKETVKDIVLSGKFGTLGLEFDVTNADLIRATKLLKELGLKDKIKVPFDTLSKGERQNVLIARAFMNNPEILILDEPGTGLDVLARENLLATIRKMSEEQNVTTIYVTHYPEEILMGFDHCLLLKNGLVYKQGMTLDLMTTENMSEFFSHDVKVALKDGRYDFDIKSNTYDFSDIVAEENRG